MADEIDLANGIIEGQLSHALRRIRDNAAQGLGTKFCIKCDDDMPIARQQLGFKQCVACAQESERRKSLYADD